MVRAKILRDWIMESKGFDLEVELNRLVAKSGPRIIEIPIQYRPSLGKKKLGMKHSVEIFKRMML